MSDLLTVFVFTVVFLDHAVERFALKMPNVS